MVANLTTPLLGIVSTSAIGRLGDAALLGGVAMAAIAFDCVFWLFGFLRMGTVAFTAQALGAQDRVEIRAVLVRSLILAGVIGIALVGYQEGTKSAGNPFSKLVSGSSSYISASMLFELRPGLS